MKQSILMRVLFCKIHCPSSFICFCKPSVAHLYNPGPLKLENNPHVPSTVVSVTDSSHHQLSAEVTEVKEGSEDGTQQAESVLRSCIKKVPSEPQDIEKKKVQWMDNIGKELVEIKEFESSYAGDADNEQEHRACVCIIL